MSTPEPDQDPYGYHTKPDPYGNGPIPQPPVYPPPPPSIPYAQQPHPLYAYPPPYVQPRPPMSAVAVVSLVFGLIGIFTFWLIVPPVVALLTGAFGLWEIRKHGERGSFSAGFGMFLGIVGTLAGAAFYAIPALN